MANQLEEVVAVPADAAESSVPPEDTKTPESLQRKQLQNILARLKLKQFKSNGQAKLVQEVVFGKTSVLGVLPTGGGKSLAMFACLYAPDRELTVAIFPLIAVLGDVKERLAKMSEEGLLQRQRYEHTNPRL